MAAALNENSREASRPLVPGIYAPLPTFYLDNDEQDLGEFLKSHPAICVARERQADFGGDLLMLRYDRRHSHSQETRCVPRESRNQTPSGRFHG